MTQLKADTPSSGDLPDFLASVIDIDSHEMIPSYFWNQEFGDVADVLLPLTDGILGNAGANTMLRDDITSDLVEITDDNVRNMKGPQAPAAIDFNRRPDVLNAMGVARQLVFPSFGLIGMSLRYNENAADFFKFDPANFDRFDVGRRVIQASNQWAARVMKTVDAESVRPVGLLMTDSLDQMMRDAEEALSGGIVAFWISGSTPPAGTSPADPALDPFWDLMARSNTAVTLHLGTEFGLLKDTRWTANVAQFASSSTETVEFNLEPYRCATLHLQNDNFLTTMVLGGVFERHPDLRFGVIECSGHWVGPLADQLDVWHGQFRRRLDAHLSMRPSDYIARNVRVTPFHFEPVDEYIEKYPKMESVYCYSSDYPHIEGGRESVRTFYNKLRRLGDEVAQRFFVDNGELLLPASNNN